MVLLYYPPFPASDDEEMLELATVALRAYVEDLSDFPEHVLRGMWRETRRYHKVERWPTISAILSAAKAPPINAINDARGADKYRPPTAIEAEYQRTAYGQVHMNNVRNCDIDHHREQAERKKAGKIHVRELNPFAGKDWRPGYRTGSVA